MQSALLNKVLSTAATLAYAWHTGENLFTESTVHTVSPDTSDYDGGRTLNAERMEHWGYDRMVDLSDLEKDAGELIKVTGEVQSELIKVEHDNVVNTLLEIAQRRSPVVAIYGTLIPEENADVLYRARSLATKIFPHG